MTNTATKMKRLKSSAHPPKNVTCAKYRGISFNYRRREGCFCSSPAQRVDFSFTETQSRLAHAIWLRAHWPMHRDPEQTGPFTETQSRLAHAPRLRADWPMHRGSEQTGQCTDSEQTGPCTKDNGPCTETQRTFPRLKGPVSVHGPMCAESQCMDPCALSLSAWTHVR